MRFEGRRGNGGGGFGGGRRFGGGGPPRRFDDSPKPIKVGEEYDVEINEVGSRGDGIARIKNFVVFINGAKQGEKMRIKITEVRNRFAVAEKAGAASAETSESSSEGGATESTEEAVSKAEAEESGDEESEESEEEKEEELR